MAGSVVFTPNTDRDKVGTIEATWEEPTGEKFVFAEDQVNTNTTQKTNFVTRAKAKQAVNEWDGSGNPPVMGDS